MAACFAALRLIHRKRRRERKLRCERYLKDLQNPFNLDEAAFKKKFILSEQGIQYIAGLIGPIMKKNQGYPIELQILASLQVLRSGSYQQQVGEDRILLVSQATVSRSLDIFLDAIMEVVPKIIEFPNYSEIAFSEQKFYGQSKIPNIVGVLDCMPVRIHRPTLATNSVYLNKENECSLNVQLVCDSNLLVLDAVQLPGSVSNTKIWMESSLRNMLKNNTMPHRTFLIGDSSFPLEPWLLVPYEDCDKTEELIFNDHIHRALSIAKKCSATLRARFRCLHHQSVPLHYSPEKCSKIIMACIVLHNICVKLNISLSEPINVNQDYYTLPVDYSDTDSETEETILRNEAMSVRDEIAKQLLKL